MMFGVQAPPSTCMQVPTSQASGGSGERFLRIFKAMQQTSGNREDTGKCSYNK
jgi:hypothetical protein